MKKLVFYRTDGHYSSWTYRITSENSDSWDEPEKDVVKEIKLIIRSISFPVKILNDVLV